MKASGSGELTYQWYSNTAKQVSNAVKIPGATKATYSPPTTTASTLYYYCVVTNTDAAVTSTAARSVTSSIATVTVNALSTTAPLITAQPSPVTVYAGSASQLSVSAAASGTLSYQWYSNTTGTATNATPVAGATKPSFTVPTGTEGTVYYYCVLTNTVSGGSNAGDYTAASDIVPVAVKPATAITKQPAGVTVSTGDTAVLSVEASGSATLSYQWYAGSSGNTAAGSKITGATAATYSVPTNVSGTVYYYCVVTNTDSTVTSSDKTSTATTTPCSCRSSAILSSWATRATP